MRVLDLPHGIPSKDVFGRVLSALEPQAFQAGFSAWLESLRETAETRVAAVPQAAQIKQDVAEDVAEDVVAGDCV